jgi:hypothetical protein
MMGKERVMMLKKERKYGSSAGRRWFLLTKVLSLIHHRPTLYSGRLMQLKMDNRGDNYCTSVALNSYNFDVLKSPEEHLPRDIHG